MMQKKLAFYIKATKTITKHCTNCLNRLNKLGILPIKIDLLNYITLEIAKLFLIYYNSGKT